MNIKKIKKTVVLLSNHKDLLIATKNDIPFLCPDLIKIINSQIISTENLINYWSQFLN